MASRKTSDARTELGRQLKLARLRANITTGTEMAERLGWHQTKVSKMELGTQLPNRKELERWADACEAQPHTRGEFRELLAHARLGATTWSEEYRGGDPVTIAAHTAESGAPDFDDLLMRCYAPSIIPRILQTEGYATEQLTGCNGMVMTLTPEAIGTIVAQRMKRQAVLREPGRDVCLVIGESALRTRFGSEETLLVQLEQVLDLMDLPALDLRILPLDRPCPIVPLTGFRLVGDTVVIGMFHGEITLSSPEEFDAYTAAFEALWSASLTGEGGAENLILCAVDALRSQIADREGTR